MTERRSFATVGLGDAVASMDRSGQCTRMILSVEPVARLTAVTGSEAHRAMYRGAAARLAGEDIPADEPLSRIKARLGL